MICKKKAAVGCILSCLTSLVMANNVLFSQNFDTEFTAGVLNGSKKIAGGDYIVQDNANSMEIVSDAKSAPHALRIGRKGVVGFTAFRSTKNVPYGNDFKVSFDVKVAPKYNVIVFIGGRGQAPIGAINMAGGSAIQAYNAKKVWANSALPACPANQWVNVSVNFKGNSQTYNISVTYPDGSVKTSTREYPFLNKANVAEVRFLNALPVGSNYLIDNIKLEDLGKNTAPASIGKITLSQNFDTDFKPAVLSGSAKFTGGDYTVQDDLGSMEIVQDAKSAPNALKIGRKGAVGFTAIRSNTPVPDGNNFEISFDVKVAPKNNVTVFIGGRNQPPLGAINLAGGLAIRGYNAKKVWTNSGLTAFPVNQWVHISVNFNAGSRTYNITVTDPNNSVKTGVVDFPFLGKANVSEVRFFNSPPIGNTFLIDNIVIKDLGKPML